MQSLVCDAISTRKICKSKVHAKHNSITVSICKVHTFIFPLWILKSINWHRLLCYSLENKTKNARVASTAPELNEKSKDSRSSTTASRWSRYSYYFLYGNCVTCVISLLNTFDLSTLIHVTWLLLNVWIRFHKYTICIAANIMTCIFSAPTSSCIDLTSDDPIEEKRVSLVVTSITVANLLKGWFWCIGWWSTYSRRISFSDGNERESQRNEVWQTILAFVRHWGEPSDPHTSMTALRMRVCIYACLFVWTNHLP